MNKHWLRTFCALSISSINTIELIVFGFQGQLSNVELNSIRNCISHTLSSGKTGHVIRKDEGAEGERMELSHPVVEIDEP